MKDRPEEYSKYTWTRPLPAKKLDVIKDYSAVKHVLDHPHTFVSSYRERLSEIVQGRLPTREVVSALIAFSSALVLMSCAGRTSASRPK